MSEKKSISLKDISGLEKKLKKQGYSEIVVKGIKDYALAVHKFGKGRIIDSEANQIE